MKSSIYAMALPTLLTASLLLLVPPIQGERKMTDVFVWNEIDYTFYDDNSRRIQVEDGRFILGNSVPISLEVDTRTDRVFISMPRFRPGNAATLAVVSQTQNERGQYLLKPYPDWRYHRQGDCEGITSVFRTYIDECRRLWVVDSGTVGGSVDVATGVNRICPAQLLIFDLENNRLQKRFEWPESIIKAETVLTTIAVEVRDTANKCAKTFAYVADVSGFQILVYDMQKDEAWRVQANEMFPYPPFGVYHIAGSTFDLMDGVLALALSPKDTKKDRTLYFHSLSSDVESWVSTHIMRNKSNFAAGSNLVPREFKVSRGHRAGQAASMSMDDNGVLFFSVLPKLSINCWNTRLEYEPANIVELEVDPEAFQFIAGVKVTKDKQGVPELWVLSSRFQRHMTGGVDAADVNYRVMKSPIARLVKGTSCDVKQPGGPQVPVTLPGNTGGGSYGGGTPRPGGNRPGGNRPGGNRPGNQGSAISFQEQSQLGSGNAGTNRPGPYTG